MVIGRVAADQTAVGGPCTIREWHCDRTHRLFETPTSVPFLPADGSTLVRAICWLDAPEPPPERAQWVHSRLPRKHVPPPTWRWAGFDGTARVDPTEWMTCGRPTLRLEPRRRLLARLRNRDVYSALLSLLFDEHGQQVSAFPTAFRCEQRRPAQPRAAGPWRYLLDLVPAGDDLSPATRAAVGEVFASSRTQALPLRARQSLWQLHTCGLPIGDRTGGDGMCPVAAAADPATPPVPETHLQLAVYSPTAQRVWQQVLGGLHVAGPMRLPWGAHVMDGELPDRTALRAIVLGLIPAQPAVSRADREAFALVRGLTVDALVRHRHSVSLAVAEGRVDPEYDPVRACSALYAQIRAGALAALRGEHARHRLLARQMRGAGLPLASCYGPNGPLARWEAQWLRAGVASLAGDGSLDMQLLPRDPPMPLGLAGPIINLQRLAPRPDWAPPGTLPSTTRQVLLAAPSDGSAWGAVVLRGGDCLRDQHAVHVADLAGPVSLDRAAADFVDATVLSPVVAELSAALWALASLHAQGGVADTSPVALRFSEPQAAALAAGTCHPPPALARICGALLRRLLAARERRSGCVWVVGWRPDRRHVWGARALSLSQWGRDGYVARPPTMLAPELAGVAHAAPPALTSCSVCLDDFESDLPHPDHCSPCPRGRWACHPPRLAHFVCLACDAQIQNRVNNRCPECRAGRVVILADA